MCHLCRIARDCACGGCLVTAVAAATPGRSPPPFPTSGPHRRRRPDNALGSHVLLPSLLQAHLLAFSLPPSERSSLFILYMDEPELLTEIVRLACVILQLLARRIAADEEGSEQAPPPASLPPLTSPPYSLPTLDLFGRTGTEKHMHRGRVHEHYTCGCLYYCPPASPSLYHCLWSPLHFVFLVIFFFPGLVLLPLWVLHIPLLNHFCMGF